MAISQYQFKVNGKNFFASGATVKDAFKNLLEKQAMMFLIEFESKSLGNDQMIFSIEPIIITKRK